MRISAQRGARTSLAVFGMAAALAAQPAVPIRWSAIGASITAGSGYPAKLQTLLGPAFQVENEGISGCTMLKNGDFPYWTKGRLPQTFAFKPDIVTVDLGGNDAKPQNWDAHKNEFIPDFLAMVDTLKAMPSKPKVFPSTPQPSFLRNGQYAFGISNIVIRDEIIPRLKQFAKDRNLTLIDSYTPWENLDLTSDGVHPDPAKPGADSIAAFIYRTFRESAVRVACIGNSITDNGHGAGAYPIKFNQLLGRDYLVLNAGHSGKTLLRKGDAPYIASPWFAEVFKFKPNIITIKLGTNDSKPQNWGTHKDEFAPDLRWLIDTLMTLSTKPRIYLCTPIPAWKDSSGNDPYGINGDIIKNEIIPKIRQVGQERGLTVLDLHTPYLPYHALTPDGVHPNAVGLDTLAHILFRAYKATPVAVLDPVPARRSPLAGRMTGAWDPANPIAGYGIDAAGRARN
ncbi:MAG: sialate O-acetylesterase [Fibrobacteres bacterium]|nr:sialate O-acetylesterase [Fibrobacterota bacterium]